jgi:hypothetical protein
VRKVGSKSHRQNWLSSLERLALTLLVDAQNKRAFRRIQVQTDEIAQLLDEQRIGRELEGFGAMRLQPKEAEIAVHALRRDTALSRLSM